MLLACVKPKWISSFDVVKIIRTHVQDKVGHSGTLDPMASGLMILGVGKGTKQLTSLIGLDKSYETTIDFSLLTDTRDASFREQEERFEVIRTPLIPLTKGDADKPSLWRRQSSKNSGREERTQWAEGGSSEQKEKAPSFSKEGFGVDLEQKNPLNPPYEGGCWSASLMNMKGESVGTWLIKDWKQIPAPALSQITALLDSILYQEGKETLLPLPTFSAKKQNGKRLYKDARKGKAEIQEKPMKIYAYKIVDYQFPLLKVKLAVGSGTYIRSIGYRLGQQLGLGGALIQLERTSTGKFQLSTIGTENYAKGNIKGQERTIYYKEVDLEEILDL